MTPDVRHFTFHLRHGVQLQRGYGEDPCNAAINLSTPNSLRKKVFEGGVYASLIRRKSLC